MITDGLKLFTIQHVHSWLDGTSETEGLSQYVITHSRARAIVNNPYVRDDDVIASAIYKDGELAAYTAAFPDMIQGKRSWWFTTLWCEPKHQGKGFGLIVIGSICECHDGEPAFDMWGAPETVEIFRHLGLFCTTAPEFVFSLKKICPNSLKAKMAIIKQYLWLKTYSRRSLLVNDVNSRTYTLQYCDSIDEETWNFILSHNKCDAFQRTREMLNWILQWPFFTIIPLTNRSQSRNQFSDAIQEYWIKCVKVFSAGLLKAVYILRWDGTELSVKYSWGCDNEDALVSIGEHLLNIGASRFTTRDSIIADFISKWNLFPVVREDSISLSYPVSFKLNGRICGGDADNFA